jgi:hypothetical protein
MQEKDGTKGSMKTKNITSVDDLQMDTDIGHLNCKNVSPLLIMVQENMNLHNFGIWSVGAPVGRRK